MSTLGECDDAGGMADKGLERRSRFRVRKQRREKPSPHDANEISGDYCAFMLSGLAGRKRRGGDEVVVVRDPITVAVQRPGRAPLRVDIGLDNTVRDLKVLVQRGCDLSPDEQRLVFARREMDEGKTLADCGITDGSTLHARLRLRAC